MLLPQKVILKWIPRRKKYYTSKGYKFTKMGESFEVDVNDLQKGSEEIVKYRCDYCLEVRSKPYKYIVKTRELNEKDCCGDVMCLKKKRKDTWKVPVEESFAYKYPEISEQWDYEKNIKSPYDYFAQSNTKVWWVCSKGHSWKTSIYKRGYLGRDCHYCTGRAVDESNSLQTLSPELASEWDFEGNNGLTPNDVTISSGKKVRWKCASGHTWDAKVASRSRGSGCPICSESTGERMISEWLDSKGINYKREVSSNNLLGVGGGELRFDFALVDDQEYIKAFLEFDGIFHFEKVYEGDGHENIVKHDSLKNEFCEREGFPLVRIPYTSLPNLSEELGEHLAPIFPEVF